MLESSYYTTSLRSLPFVRPRQSRLRMSREENTCARPRKRKRQGVSCKRDPCAVYVESSEELIYITAERGHWGVMLSELDELGRIICRRCVEAGRLIESKKVVYIPPTMQPTQDETVRRLWMESHRARPRLAARREMAVVHRRVRRTSEDAQTPSHSGEHRWWLRRP